MEGISCICPTFGRPGSALHLLEEAVECFRRQETDCPRELLILNDCAAQELYCNVPGVRVVNYPVRYQTLGEKYNAMVLMARYDLLAPWEDDDLSLPDRLAQALEALAQGYDHFNPKRTWFLDQSGLHTDHHHGYCHNASVFTRSAWQKVGGYPHVSGPQDALMDGALLTHTKTAPFLTDDPATWTMIYRWGCSPFHLSGQPDTNLAYQNHALMPRPAGRFRIHPHWQDDYVAMIRRHLSTGATCV